MQICLIQCLLSLLCRTVCMSLLCSLTLYVTISSLLTRPSSFSSIRRICLEKRLQNLPWISASQNTQVQQIYRYKKRLEKSVHQHLILSSSFRQAQIHLKRRLRIYRVSLKVRIALLIKRSTVIWPALQTQETSKWSLMLSLTSSSPITCVAVASTELRLRLLPFEMVTSDWTDTPVTLAKALPCLISLLSIFVFCSEYVSLIFFCSSVSTLLE